jgi:hypothetical protein
MTAYVALAWSIDLERFVTEPADDHDALSLAAERLATEHGVAFVFRRFRDRVVHLMDLRADDVAALEVRRAHAAWTVAAHWLLASEAERRAWEHAALVGSNGRAA